MGTKKKVCIENAKSDLIKNYANDSIMPKYIGIFEQNWKPVRFYVVLFSGTMSHPVITNGGSLGRE